MVSSMETQSGKYTEEVKKSGLLSGGGFGFTLGSEERKDQYDNQNVEQAGSTVGSISGNVNIEAGKDVSISASDVLAGKDINLTGQNVTIESADNTYNYQEKHEYKKSGLTVSLSTAALSVAGSVHDTIKNQTALKMTV
ncbi:MAG: hemagglutinin repeat-containing protein [Acidaminococcaceae bacterium]|nr:hemagglutinin repeat-containing protein [Acidaminococcaceae bacterium]